MKMVIDSIFFTVMAVLAVVALICGCDALISGARVPITINQTAHYLDAFYLAAIGFAAGALALGQVPMLFSRISMPILGLYSRTAVRSLARMVTIGIILLALLRDWLAGNISGNGLPLVAGFFVLYLVFEAWDLKTAERKAHEALNARKDV